MIFVNELSRICLTINTILIRTHVEHMQSRRQRTIALDARNRFARKSVTIEHYLKANGCKDNPNYPDSTYFIDEDQKIEFRESSIPSNSQTLRAKPFVCDAHIPVDETLVMRDRINVAQLP